MNRVGLSLATLDTFFPLACVELGIFWHCERLSALIHNKWLVFGAFLATLARHDRGVLMVLVGELLLHS